MTTSDAEPLHATPPVLAERGWRLRLHGPGAPPSAVAAARRAVRAALADPGERAVGFALLRPSGDGGWALLAHVWRGAELVREASLLLSEDGGPPRRCPALARSLGTAEDVLRLGREAEAWGRCGGDADAYLAATDR